MRSREREREREREMRAILRYVVAYVGLKGFLGVQVRPLCLLHTLTYAYAYADVCVSQ